MRQINRLSTATIETLVKPGLYADGLGLYLQISTSGTKAWIFRFMLNGRPRKMGLGPAHTITLTEARKNAAEARRKVYSGIDPIEHRKAQRSQI